MELEYENPNRRRFIVVVGVIFAVVAAAGVFIIIQQATDRVSETRSQTVPVVVAVHTIPARKIIEGGDVVVREIPINPTNAQGIVSTPDKVIGRIPSVAILQDQMITTNLLASSTEGGQFSILGPDESIAPDSAAWRAVSITVPADRAVGGLITANDLVDVLVTASINVLTDPTSGADPKGYYSDKSTKISYQGLVVLAKSDDVYILKVPIDVAEEILHLQATGSAMFSLVLRPSIDTRQVDTTDLGTTTNKVIIRYGLPIPVLYPPPAGPIPTPAPTPIATPIPSPAPSAAVSPAP
jgi:Flp pilus assembly protein CpaB